MYDSIIEGCLRSASSSPRNCLSRLHWQPGQQKRRVTVHAAAGHYIVVCGYDSETDRFMLQDPASSAQLDSVPTSNLEAARHAYGTDEDLLLVTVPPSFLFGHPLVSL